MVWSLIVVVQQIEQEVVGTFVEAGSSLGAGSDPACAKWALPPAPVGLTARALLTTDSVDICKFWMFE